MEFDFGRQLAGPGPQCARVQSRSIQDPFHVCPVLVGTRVPVLGSIDGQHVLRPQPQPGLGPGWPGRPVGLPLEWETAIFNGFVTGGAETGSVGALDNNFAYSAHVFAFPTGEWGAGTLADFDWHESLATRVGAGYAGTALDRNGPTEFNMIRVVDSGARLGNLLPASVDEYNVNTFCVDASCKYRGWSVTSEYYFRNISGFQWGRPARAVRSRVLVGGRKVRGAAKAGIVVAVVTRGRYVRNARARRPEC